VLTDAASHVVETPGKLALIVVDMQNAFLRDEGSMHKLGLRNDLLEPVLPAVCRLVDIARRAEAPIVFTRFVVRSDYRDAGLRGSSYAGKAFPVMVGGTWDAELVDELVPLPIDYVVNKQRHSAFYNTNLDIILRAERVESLIVCGVTTEICVESTVRDARARDYNVFVPSDATAAFDRERHEASLRVMAFGFGQITTVGELKAALSGRLPLASAL
jgi:ureidoacrylate peracid hydrolase